MDNKVQIKQIFKSCAIAAKLMGLNRPAISQVLRGDQDSYKGFKFKYAN